MLQGKGRQLLDFKTGCGTPDISALPGGDAFLLASFSDARILDGSGGTNPVCLIAIGSDLCPNRNILFYIPKYGELPSKEQAVLILEQLQTLQQSPSSTARWKQQQLLQELLLLLQTEEEGIQHHHPHYAIAERTANYLRQHYKEPVSYRRLAEAMHFHQNYLSICMKKRSAARPWNI